MTFSFFSFSLRESQDTECTERLSATTPAFQIGREVACRSPNFGDDRLVNR